MSNPNLKEPIMIRSRSILFVCVGLLFAYGLAASGTVLAQSSPAEELTRVLPDDVLGFVATSGGESLRAGFEKSTLGRMWNDPAVEAFAESIEQELRKKFQQEVL